jgi:hypothetical protein
VVVVAPGAVVVVAPGTVVVVGGGRVVVVGGPATSSGLTLFFPASMLRYVQRGSFAVARDI